MTTKTAKVLIVEDDETNLHVAETMLGFTDCQTVRARTAKEAIDAFMSMSPDLILMDLGLPRTDGYKVAAEIRRLEANAARPVPIVAVTAFEAQDHEQRCLDAGFAAFLTKPVTMDTLIDTVTRLTSQHKDLATEH